MSEQIEINLDPISVLLGAQGQETGQITGDNLRVATLNVNGMYCQGCRLTIQNYLDSMEGTKKVEVSLSQEKAEIIYDADKISSQKLVEAKVFQGAYNASLKSDGKYSNP